MEGGSRSPGARVILFPRKGSDYNNQLFRFTPDGYIESVETGLVLDIEGGQGAGGKIVMWNRKPIQDAANQRWRYDPSTETFESFHQGLVLDAGGTNKGEHLLVWNRKGAHENHNQRFYLAQAGYAPAPVAFQPVIAPAPQFSVVGVNYGLSPGMSAPGGGYFYIKSRLHGKVLDVKGGASAPGTHVIVWDQKRGGGCANQLWRLTPEGFIQSKASGLVLDIEGGAAAGRKLCIWPQKGPSESANQRWRFDPSTEALISYSGSLVIDIDGGNKSSGAHAIAWNAKGRHENTNQRWVFEPHC